jgi:Protein of unknown function (DUF4236)
LGLSVGPKHAKISVSPGRRITTNVGIPGTGIRYTKVANAKQQSRVNQIGNVSGSHYKSAFNAFLITISFTIFGGIFAAVRPKIAIKVTPDI